MRSVHCQLQVRVGQWTLALEEVEGRREELHGLLLWLVVVEAFAHCLWMV